MRPQSPKSFALIPLALVICLAHLETTQALQDLVPSGLAKELDFNEPDTGIRYKLVAHHVNYTNKIKSVLKVYKIRLNRTLIQTDTKPQLVQVLEFSVPLVDFDLDCTRRYCYLVTATNKNRNNVDVYAWTRTQFDLAQTTSSFSTPHSLQIFSINQSNFYIAVAQDQLQLNSSNKIPVEEDEGLPRFFGCAIIKFTTSDDIYEKHLHLRYHQFIPLRFHPLSLEHLISYDQDKRRLHYLVFSRDSRFSESSQFQSPTFLWSPFDELFWPVKLPNGVVFERRPTIKYRILIFPNHNIPNLNQSTSTKPHIFQESIDQVESCFSRLQRVLFDRDQITKNLINKINPLWHSISPNGLHGFIGLPNTYTNISTKVIVHGNVIVQGTLVSGPQVTMVGLHGHNLTVPQNSPEVIDAMLSVANVKLNFLHDKLKHAFLPTINVFRSPIRFVRKIEAHKVFFTEGIRNINVHLNNIPFKKLRDDLVILDGDQDIMSKVTFTGKVFADSLEIHGLVNRKYFLRDALDIASNQVQVIELLPANNSLSNAIEFQNIASPELVMNYNSSINNIRLFEFITRDSRVQEIYGRKMFRSIEANRLDVANADVQLNDFNIARLATQALKLNSPREQVLSGRYQTFTKPVHVNRLIINDRINHRINISSLIHDSLKTYDVTTQQISGFKHFTNGLSINQLTTEGQINGIQMDQIFNLNPTRSQPDQSIIMNLPFPNTGTTVSATGIFNFYEPVMVVGNLNAYFVNEVDLSRSSVRRFPVGQQNNSPQVIRGHKSFFRSLRVNEMSVLEDDQLNVSNDNIVRLSSVNGFNMGLINSLIRKQMSNPPIFNIGTLHLDGNLDLAPNHYILGNISMICPLDSIRTTQILAGPENQIIQTPVRVDILRAHQAKLIQGALNGLSFPEDFVLKSVPDRSVSTGTQTISGSKMFNNIIIGQTLSDVQAFNRPGKSMVSNRVVFGPDSSINNLGFRELENFISHERHRNFTGETVYQTILIRGNIIAKRINGYRWPDDIMLKSVSGTIGPIPFPHAQRRIYSPIIFLNSSLLRVGHLDLKGPIHLEGLLNHVNLTEFGKNSATYGDKDLLSLGRPLRNKFFAGGLSVVNEIRSSGQIDGIHIDEMVHRVVTIGPNTKNIHITSPKSFISDVSFQGPTYFNYLNDIPLTPSLKRILPMEGEKIKIIGRKTIAGVLRINRELNIAGLVNHVDLARHIQNFSYIPVERYQRNITRTGPRMTTAPYALPTPHFHGKRELTAVSHLDRDRVSSLATRRPIAVRYESQKYMKPEVEVEKRNLQSNQVIKQLKSQIISLRLIKHNINTELVLGFIESGARDISNLYLPDKDDHYLEYSEFPRSFLQLDQLKFAFLKSTTYYMSVGAANDPFGYNTTGVYFSVGGSEIRHLFTLPISSPNSALFVRIAHQSTVFLLVSQDYNTFLNQGQPQCSLSVPPIIYNPETLYCGKRNDVGPMSGGVHVYLFNALLNSSSLTSAYFDLYQTISLSAIDSFEQFQYGSSTYVVAISRLSGQIHLLLLRGYLGFQVASSIDVPMLENVKVLFTAYGEPVLLVYLTNGDRKIMEPVIV